MHNATGDNQSDGGSDTFYDALDDEPDSFSSLSPPVDTVAKNGIRPNAWAKPGSSLSTNASDRYLAAFPPPSAQLQRSPASSLSSSGPPSHNLYRPAAQYTQTSASTPNPYPPRAEELAQRVLGRSRTPATAGSMTSENRNLFPGTSSKVPQQEEAESSRHAQSLWRREQRYGLSSVTVRDLSSPTSPFNAPSSSGGTPPSIYARVNKAHVKRGRKGWASIEPPIAGTSEATGSHQGNSAFGSDGPEKTVDAAAAAASSTNHASAQIPRVLSADTRHSTPDPDFESDPELENLSVFTPVSSTRADPCSPQHFSALIDRIMECTEHAALNEGETDAALAPLLHALRSTFSSRSALVRCFLGSEHSKGMCSHNDQSVATSVRRKGKSRQKDEDVAESSANVTTASKTQEFSYDVEKSHAPGFGQVSATLINSCMTSRTAVLARQ